LGPAKPGEALLIDARTLKMGKRLAFSDCTMAKEEDGSMVVAGSHTKFIG